MIEIRLLGELEVKRDGDAVPLPASRKSRALLGYLATTARPHRRERLCALLWEGPDDPRGALRWSLAKIRPLLESCLVTGRDHVELRRDRATIDAWSLCAPATATTAALEQGAALFRGELLEGLDLPGCYRYQQWCAGERERFRKAHLAILTELTGRFGASEKALEPALRRVAIDPFDDEAHASLIRLQAALGNPAEAMRQYEQCRELFERELGSRPGAVVEEARRGIARRRPDSPAGAPPGAPPERVLNRERGEARFVGREPELARIASAREVVLLLGEPGIGKSRLLAEVRSRSTGRSLYGRAFAAEMIRPYGVWTEAIEDFPVAEDRVQLFEAVVARLAGVELVAIDDLQWIDEASTALLHYVSRKTAVRILCAARTGEIEDNAHAMRLMRALSREGRLAEIALGPLPADALRALVPDERAARLSGGNPLFALELAHSGGSGALPAVIAARLDRLEGAARELVAWAAAVGHELDGEIVGRATGMPAGEMLAAFEKLERAGILRAAGERTWDFTHDLIRENAYQRISGPRRALVHRHIARALRETHDADGALAGDVLHHASLAGDVPTAVAAAIEAGKRCNRLFAYGEGTAVVRRGLALAEALPERDRVRSEMELMEILVLARTPIRERLPFSGRIAELVESARRLELTPEAANGAHLLACLHEESNNYSGAAVETIRSAELGRGADPATLARTIANTARCLLMLQRDVDRAASLLREARALGIPDAELSVAHGYLAAHRGRREEAVRHLEEGLEIASKVGDHWLESVALFRMITLALEEDDCARALEDCARLRAVDAHMSGGSESIRRDVLEQVARHRSGEPVDLEAAIQRLREIDSKSDLAWVLAYLASTERDANRARAWAAEGLEAADAVGRRNEAAIARKILRLPVRSSRDLSARARRFLGKEKRHGQTRARADV